VAKGCAWVFGLEAFAAVVGAIPFAIANGADTSSCGMEQACCLRDGKRISRAMIIINQKIKAVND
jgi:hypothetical protein